MRTSRNPQSIAARRGLRVPPAALVGAHILLLLAISAFSAPQAALSPGDHAPDFQLKNRDGLPIRYDAAFTTPTLFLSVKPDQTATALGEVRENFSADHLLISIAAGVPITADEVVEDVQDAPVAEADGAPDDAPVEAAESVEAVEAKDDAEDK